MRKLRLILAAAFMAIASFWAFGSALATAMLSGPQPGLWDLRIKVYSLLLLAATLCASAIWLVRRLNATTTSSATLGRLVATNGLLVCALVGLFCLDAGWAILEGDDKVSGLQPGERLGWFWIAGGFAAFAVPIWSLLKRARPRAP
jgi:hypothetical protein